MSKLSMVGLAGAVACACSGTILLIFGWSAGGGSSNALTELGSSLVSATVISLAVIGVERGLDASQRRSDEEQARVAEARDRQHREELAKREQELRAEARLSETRLMVILRPTLERADLRDMLLDGVFLSGKNLARAEVSGISLRDANLAGCILEGAVARGATFAGAVLNGANLSGTTMDRAIFDRAEMVNCLLPRARLGYASFKQAKLTGSICESSDFYCSNFDQADLCGVNFSKAAGLTSCTFRGARASDQTVWPSGVHADEFEDLEIFKHPGPLSKTVNSRDFAEVIFDSWDFHGTTFNGCIFARSWVRSADFYTATFRDCRFDGADFSGAFGLVGATFIDCSFDSETRWPALHFDPSVCRGLAKMDPR